MGKFSSSGNEAASLVVSGTFSATGQSGNGLTGSGVGGSDGINSNARAPSGGTPGQSVSPSFIGLFNFALWGTFVASVQLEKSFDGGATWLPCCEDNSGTVALYTTPVNISGYEPEFDVLYRANCTAYTSGTVNYRISQ